MNANRNGDESRSAPPRGELLCRALSERLIGIFYYVYNRLGGGFAESVYRNSMAVAFRRHGIRADRESKVNVYFLGELVGVFRPDFLVEDQIIVELKAVEHIVDSHRRQLFNYLRATDVEVGFLLNFGARPTFQRLVLSNERKAHGVPR